MKSRPARTDEEREYHSLNQRCLAGVGRRDGNGGTGEAFAAKAGRVVGVDLSRPMLVIARRNNRLPHLTFQQADATELPFGDASFDVSCVSFVLHEMPASIEPDYYLEFIRSDLHARLQRMGLDIRDDRFMLHGDVRVVIGARSGALSP